MNCNIKEIFFWCTGVITLLLSLSCSTIMEPEGDATANPMIVHIEKYMENNGHYPTSLMKLIPDYIPYFDHQAYFYRYKKARGKRLEEYIKKGFILKGKGEGYVLTVRFQKYTGECTYYNGQRKYCRYIGH